MKSLESYLRMGIRESLRQEGKTYKQIEPLEEQIYNVLMNEV